MKRYKPLSPVFFMLFIISCGAVQPVYNVEKYPIVAMKKKSIKNIEYAIFDAGKRIGWKMSLESEGHIIATIKREEHMASVNIFFTIESYNIEYKDSENMHYDGVNIHNRYNRWILNLDKNIRRMYGLR